ncbi:MAG: tRNA (N6-threonylcarbamoyladenosine(37)-N6)-methyltransferase TrmO [Lentisphaerae bacterium]|nr:tRNA (N6-threonylcarbamoyladenosine(37)-N6)-methyltransferase TrmO [Lentisphaerota bacterium]
MMLQLEPIGFFHTQAQYPYDVPRQGVLAAGNSGVIELLPGKGFEQALEDLDGFSHLWVIFWFHLNQSWHAKVRPPRHRERKVGVFASRSPYRPNPLGLSVLKIKDINGLKIQVQDHDLLDGTPILDLKPYLPYADSFPEASAGWTAATPSESHSVHFSPLAEQQLQWLSQNGLGCLKTFLCVQLASDPLNPARHRLVCLQGCTALAYRTWRACFSINARDVEVEAILSGYSSTELLQASDQYHDKELHRRFLEVFPYSGQGGSEPPATELQGSLKDIN